MASAAQPTVSATTKVSNTLAAIEKRVTRVEFTSDVITQLITGKGGVLKLPTTNQSGLDVFDKQFWAFHTPYGSPGDELWVVEDYRVVKVCATLEGYKVTMEFKDGTQVVVDYKYNVALTAEGSWIPAASMPPELSRLKLLIQSIACSGDYSEWQFTTVHLNPVTE